MFLGCVLVVGGVVARVVLVVFLLLRVVVLSPFVFVLVVVRVAVALFLSALLLRPWLPSRCYCCFNFRCR